MDRQVAQTSTNGTGGVDRVIDTARKKAALNPNTSLTVNG